MADYVKPVQRGLESIRADKFPASFEANLQQTNQSLEFLSKVVLVMQRGIDEADDTIFDDIKQLVDELIILFGGGTLGDDAAFPGLNIFDVFIQNIMAFLGFNPTAGGQNIPNMVGNFIDNILNPTGKIPTKASVDQASATANAANQAAITATSNAATARGESATALLAAQNAANAAQDASETADIAYENAQYWKDECVVASAGVVLGVNELVIGVVMDVPTGRSRRITDLHFALFNKPGIISISTKVQSAPDPSTGAMTERTVHSFSIIAGATRSNVNNLDIEVFDKERVFWDVTATGAGGTIASVLQVAIVGVLL